MSPKNPKHDDIVANKDPQQKTADRGVHIVHTAVGYGTAKDAMQA